ncbi:geraniol 8-hydroxylase-like [Asparagus officinalis]|uniref:geraniol 8-hydroxylase-like n=1 Tax=Asparagus officinalis TaxID=4686 RepID=UPI00098E6A79|nr:geraniol 8-hydroxylase-like [Asparagus officinalis]
MTVLNMLSNTLFSVDMVDAGSDSAQEFKDLVWGIMEELGTANVSDFFPLVRGLDLQGKRRRTEGYFRKLHSIFDELIDGRLKETELGHETNNDFLDAILSGQSKLDRHVMNSLLMDMFVGGTDSISHTVEWVMAELLRNPDTMRKATIKESLRLHSPGPFLLPRKAETDTELCGYSIPQHSWILVNAWALGRHESLWKDPDVFMPERFLERDVEYKGQYFEFIPFGAGRRICPGLPLASRMVPLMLASLLYHFKWELADGMRAENVDLSDKLGVTLALAHPIRAIPVPNEDFLGN